jgi:hypothetical protein
MARIKTPRTPSFYSWELVFLGDLGALAVNPFLFENSTELTL